MIDITRSHAKQITTDGVDSDWNVTLDGEFLYTMPANFTVQETFLVRDIVQQMMQRAVEETTAELKLKHDASLKAIQKTGQLQLDALKAENQRLADALEQHIIAEEVP